MLLGMEKEVLKRDEYNPLGYDPVKDLAPVDDFGFVDLHEAFLNHSIPGDLSVSSEEYNGVEEPGSLLGKSADVFEAYRKAQYVKSAESAAAAKAAAATEGAAE